MASNTLAIMAALSIVAPNGRNIAIGRKTIEVRSWRPERLPLRDLLIVENHIFLNPDSPIDPHGTAVALVDITEVHEWSEHGVQAACSTGWQPGYWAWSLSNVRPVSEPFPVAAERKLYEVAASLAQVQNAA